MLMAWSRFPVRCVFLRKNYGPYTKQPQLKINEDNNLKKKTLLLNTDLSMSIIGQEVKDEIVELTLAGGSEHEE